MWLNMWEKVAGIEREENQGNILKNHFTKFSHDAELLSAQITGQSRITG